MCEATTEEMALMFGHTTVLTPMVISTITGALTQTLIHILGQSAQNARRAIPVAIRGEHQVMAHQASQVATHGEHQAIALLVIQQDVH